MLAPSAMHALLALLLLTSAAAGDRGPRPAGVELKNFDAVEYNLYVLEAGKGRHIKIGAHRTREICASACAVAVKDTAEAAAARPGERLLIKHGLIGPDPDHRPRR